MKPLPPPPPPRYQSIAGKLSAFHLPYLKWDNTVHVACPWTQHTVSRASSGTWTSKSSGVGPMPTTNVFWFKIINTNISYKLWVTGYLINKLTWRYVCRASLLCSNTLLLNFIIFFGGNSGVFICFLSCVKQHCKIQYLSQYSKVKN